MRLSIEGNTLRSFNVTVVKEKLMSFATTFIRNKFEMDGIRHGKESLASVVTWSACPTRSVSSASIAIKIETDDELNECSPLLAAHWHSRSHNYPDYGLKSEQESKYLSLNNHDRLPVTRDASRNKHSNSMHYHGSKEHICSIRLFGVLFILISGLIVATYLMVAESRLPTLSFALDLVNHDIWSKLPIPLASALNHTSFLNVLLLHTGGMNCLNSVSCINILKQMQIQQSQNLVEMPYNFLVADDGQTYEVRGWDHTSGYRSVPQKAQDTSLVIGFIGNYTNTAPNTILLQSALSLIKESVRRKKLLREYRVYGIRNITAADNDAEALFRYIADWPSFERLLEVI